jgi:putative transposase
MGNPFRYFNSSPEVIRLVVMMYVRFPLSLRNVEDLLAEPGIDISHETVREHRHRQASGLLRGNERNWRCRSARGLSPPQQSR